MVQEGLSDHDWRIVWEEVLDDEARRRIKRAIWRGESLGDPDEAAVAIERAQRMRRVVPWSVLMNIVAGLVVIALAFYLVDLPATANFWWFIGVYVLLVVLSPAAGWVRRRQLDRAIAANDDYAGS